MSRRAFNKKYLTLSNVRVAYRPKDDTIHLTSTDKDLAGEAFRVTLKPGTESDQIMRQLLFEKGLIKEDSVTAENLPNFAHGNWDPQGHWQIIPIGIGFDDQVSFEISTNPAVLVVGGSGSGKTVLQRGLIHHCLVHNSEWAVYGVDLKGQDLPVYMKYENTVRDIATTVIEARLMLEKIEAEMMRRYGFLESRGLNNLLDATEDDQAAGDTKALMIIVDEYESLMTAPDSLSYEDEAEDRKAIRGIIEKIVRLGRAAKIHMVLSSQEFKNSEIVQNCAVKIALGKLPAEQSQMIFGDDSAETNTSLRGRGVIWTRPGVRKFQTFFKSESDSDEWVMHHGENAEPGLNRKFNEED